MFAQSAQTGRKSAVEALEDRKLYSAAPTDVRAMLSEGLPLEQATDLGQFGTHRSRAFSAWVGGGNSDQSIYALDVTAPINLTVKLSNVRQSVQTQLLFADGSPIASARNPYSRSEQIIQRLDPGTYYVQMICGSDTDGRVSVGIRSAKARSGSVAPQAPSDSVAPADTAFSLTNPFGPTSAPDSTGDSTGAIPAGITPDATQDLQYMGGNVISKLNFANIYVGGSDWTSSDMSNIDAALAAALSDPTIDGVMQQYFSGAATTNFLGSAVLPGSAPATVTQDALESYLAGLDARGYLTKFSLNNTCFNFMLPPGTVLSDGSANSLNGLGGFHGSVHATSPSGSHDTVYYAVGVYSESYYDGSANGIPVFDASWKNVVGTFYHELNEVRTDPDVEDANRFNDMSYCGWISNSGNEIGDYPIFDAGNAGLPLTSVFSEVPLANGSGTVPIQLMWSNQAHAPVDPTGQAAGASDPSGNWWDWFLKFD